MTVAEISAVGLPAVYVPLPHGNGEQALNAKDIVSAGGAIMIADGELNPAKVEATVVPLLADVGRLADMAERTASSGHRDAADAIARRVLAAAASR